MTVNDVEDDRLDELARTAWHPVSEPPTEADGDYWGLVVVRCDEYTQIAPWQSLEMMEAESMDSNWEWARINDVVLQPPA